MPLAVPRKHVEDTIELLRLIEQHAADGPTRAHAKRLADYWSQQLDPTGLLVP